MTRAQDQARKAERLVAQCQRRWYVGANQRLEAATRRAQMLSGAAQRQGAR